MINRRSVLIAGCAALVATLPRVPRAATPRPIIPLWPDPPPGGGGPAGPQQRSAEGAVSNIAVPRLEVFEPARANGAAVLVAAGGGYQRIEIEKEAYPAARWLAARGITAFVLTYRLPVEGWNAGPLAPLQDAQRALRVIRSRTDLYGIDVARVGVLGFSAGGHLMGLAATRFDFNAYPEVDTLEGLSARPDNAALLYPLITLEPPYDNTAARRALIGEHPDARESAEWSVQNHLSADDPPMFLVQAADDPISNPANTRIMAEACKRAEVPFAFHALPSGGHGFGMGKASTPSAAWPAWYETWLRNPRAAEPRAGG
jgi:acetyl esterase/lipase